MHRALEVHQCIWTFRTRTVSSPHFQPAGNPTYRMVMCLLLFDLKFDQPSRNRTVFSLAATWRARSLPKKAGHQPRSPSPVSKSIRKGCHTNSFCLLQGDSRMYRPAEGITFRLSAIPRMDRNLNHSLADRTSENERRDSNPSSEVMMTAELNRCDPRR